MRNLILASVLSLFLAAALSSCTDDPTTAGQNDTSGIVVYNNLVVHEFFSESSQSAINLNVGQITSQLNNSNWDVRLVDSSGTSANFYFRSADLGRPNLPGYQTRFGFGYSNISQTQWDTLSRIPDTDDTLTASDFTQNDTQVFGTFNVPLAQNRVYSFYLVGRQGAGFNGGVPMFGMIRLDNATVSGGEKQFTIDVKVNTKGRNRFNPNATIVP